MKIRRHGSVYNFIGDTDTGITFRWGKTLDDNPVCAPWVELADISISNHCTKGCKFCYRKSSNNNSFMSLNDYEFILKSLKHPKWGNIFQVALGGGEPLEHPDFIGFIKLSNKYNVVPNFTTNGIHLNKKIVEEIKGLVGAVAISVSALEELDRDKVDLLIKAGIKTNLHFVLSKNSLNEAIDILNGVYNKVLEGINGLVFLTYKPAGRATHDDCLIMDENLKVFTNLLGKNSCNVRVGVDACFVPLLLHNNCININYVDPCECGFFSIYIDENLNVKPCSFANNDEYTFNLKRYSFKEIWDVFLQQYRDQQTSNNCQRKCVNKEGCRGKCPYYDEIKFCYSTNIKEKICL